MVLTLRIKWLLAVIISLTVVSALNAQHDHSWFRLTLSVPVKQRIIVDAELQHRRQNGFDNVNVLDKNLLFSARSWVHYQFRKHLKVSISPFAYFSYYKIIQARSDESAAPNGEVRFSAAADLQHPVFIKMILQYRSAVEYRMMENNPVNVVRFRNRLGVRYDLSNKLKAGVFDELFFNVTGTSSGNRIDQNRIIIQLDYKVTSHLKLESGYIHLTRWLPSNNLKINENTIFLNAIYQLSKKAERKAPAQ